MPNRPGLENSKKIQKNSKNYKRSFRHYFYSNRDDIGRERVKKNFVPNSVPTRPGQKNSKKNSNKIQKIKEPHSGIVSFQNGMR